MRYYAVYAACLACVCYTMQDYNFGTFGVAIALCACYCVHIDIAMWLFIVCAVGIVLLNNDKE